MDAQLQSLIANNSASISALSARLQLSEEAVERVAGSTDTFYLLIQGTLVFWMQAGFSLLEAGSVRTKNAPRYCQMTLRHGYFLVCLHLARQLHAPGWPSSAHNPPWRQIAHAPCNRRATSS